MNIVPNENTFQGFSDQNLLSATVMEKISKNSTKPPVQCQIEILKTLKTPKILATYNHRFHFLPSPFQIVRRLLRMGDIDLLEAMTPRRSVML